MPALDTWLWAAGSVCVFGGIAVAWVLVRGGARLPVVMGLRDPEPEIEIDWDAEADAYVNEWGDIWWNAKPVHQPRTTPPIARRDEFGTGTPEYDFLVIETWVNER
jgi:hypothetical protein